MLPITKLYVEALLINVSYFGVGETFENLTRKQYQGFP